MPAKRDLTGMRMGRLVAIKQADHKAKGGQILWECKCDCGNEVLVTTSNFTRGNSTSCGCKRTEHKYGDKSTKRMRIYKIYYAILQRCFNPNSKAYKWYGGRGITICAEWKDSFESFMSWALLNGYSDSLTIDRIDHEGNYEPNNCRWITQAEQLNNTRSNIVITCDGKTMDLMQWSRHLGVSYDMLRSRHRLGWDPERVIKEPPKKYKRRERNE